MKKSWRVILRRNRNREVLLQRSIGCLAAVGMIAGVMATGYAAPQGGQVTTGSAAIQHDGANTTIHQHSDRAAIQWNSFNIGRGEQVQFIQPNTSSIALNRVLGADASKIYGTMTANGQVFLINPNGVLFAPGSSVNVGGLVVSTSNITDEQLLKESPKMREQELGEFYGFRGGQGGMIINQGNIKTVDGNVELFGSVINNDGIITAYNSSYWDNGKIRLVGNTIDLAVGSKLETEEQVLLRSDVNGSGLGSISIAAGTVIAPDTTIYYRLAAYDDAATKSDAAGNPYSALLPGTKVASYMLVNTTQELQSINANLGGYYALNNDLDLAGINFSPLGNGSAFSGKLDGSGHRISNLTINSDAANVGLFGSLDHAWISNLIVTDAAVLGTASGSNTNAGILAGTAIETALNDLVVNGRIESSATNVGGAAGHIRNSNLASIKVDATVIGSQSHSNVGGTVGLMDNSTLINVRGMFPDSYKAVVSGQSHSNVGGAAGLLINGSLIDGIRQTGSVTGRSYSNIGGIVGASFDSSVSRTGDVMGDYVWRNDNEGTVGVESGDGIQLLDSKVGGVVGFIRGGTLNANNSGAVNGGYAKYIGGVVGYAENILYGDYWDRGSNSGMVVGRADGSYVGGIFGYSNETSLGYVANSGKIINFGNNSFTGGIFGGTSRGSTFKTDNYGAVTAAGIGTTVGGIAGYMINNSVIGPYTYNYGNITGGSRNSNIGGIAGYAENGLYVGFNYGGVVTDSINLSEDASYNNIGGLFGKVVGGEAGGNNYKGIVISNNIFNNVGGIAGYAKNTNASGRNEGAVTGQQHSNIGGIYGYSVGSTIHGAINTGDVSGYGWHVGGIVGSNVGGTISESNNTGAIVSWADRSYVGGLVGSNYNGSIIKSTNSGVVENHGAESAAGGIAGTSWQQSVIEQAHNSGMVSAVGQTTNTGGIVGSNGAGSDIANSYNTGAIYGGSGLYSAAGGLAGWHQAGTITNSYNNGQVGAGQFALTGDLIGKEVPLYTLCPMPLTVLSTAILI